MFFRRLEELCTSKNITLTDLTKILGISKSNITNWRNGSIPKSDKIHVIADYFDVSTDYLLGKTEEKKPIDNDRLNEILNVLPHENVRMIPVFDCVSAGFGAYACSDIIDYRPIYIKNDYDAENTICINVKGDSMAPKIEDGDTIQVLKVDSVDNGSIAVVLLDGDEGLVKKVKYGPDWIELHSINPYYPPMRFEGADVLRIRVVGLVKSVIKHF